MGIPKSKSNKKDASSKEEGTKSTTTITTKRWSHVAKSVDGSGQYLGIESQSGRVFSWGRSNAMGQLGRKEEEDSKKRKNSTTKPHIVEGLPSTTKATKVYAGGSKESGHSAIFDTDGNFWVAGCDRWQQLGLGSPHGGSAGYTWEDGRIWRPFFTLNKFATSFLKERGGDTSTIRDVALGCDHTVLLSSNQSDVYTFGKGGEGQLGLVGKLFVSAPVLSTVLSSKKIQQEEGRIAAVCAIQHCSLTLDNNGKILKKAGRCRENHDTFQTALMACLQRATNDGLIEQK